ncbi:hypothetical protein STCU_03481 [Strigomonas culicis]|nr:hypothetical protein STCU_03481 [Strigomonas culicis]|eukprot:EPY31387.1 hypothetical protein STCU_03481 [Strigomonas culicis]
MILFMTKSASSAIGLTRILSTSLFTLFLIGEELNLLTKMGILNLPALTERTNRIRVVFLFYSNVCRLIMNYLILKDFNYDEAKQKKAAGDKSIEREYKRLLYAVWDGFLMTVYTYTMQKRALPAGPSHLPKALFSGDLVEIITACAPPVYAIPNTPQGLMGLIASVPGFLSSFV